MIQLIRQIYAGRRAIGKKRCHHVIERATLRMYLYERHVFVAHAHYVCVW